MTGFLQRFDHIAGNDRIKKMLCRMAEEKKIPQSLAFLGSKGIGKGLFAEAFAQLIVNASFPSHPDIHRYYPEGKSGLHSIQAMREFSETVYMAPFHADRKVFMIHDAHRMLVSGANALLKTFEEPALDSTIILLSDEPEKLLPTILSRCQKVRFLPVPTDEGEALKNNVLQALAKGALSSYSLSLQFAEDLSHTIEAELKKVEEELREKISCGFTDTPSAALKQQIEKEVEGAISVRKGQAFRNIVDAILFWYRDLHALSVTADTSYLLNSPYAIALVQAFQRGEGKPVEQVERAVQEAALLLERSTSLPICLENIFLKLAA